jgi:hypothetical protein
MIFQENKKKKEIELSLWLGPDPAQLQSRMRGRRWRSNGPGRGPMAYSHARPGCMQASDLHPAALVVFFRDDEKSAA